MYGQATCDAAPCDGPTSSGRRAATTAATPRRIAGARGTLIRRHIDMTLDANDRKNDDRRRLNHRAAPTIVGSG